MLNSIQWYDYLWILPLIFAIQISIIKFIRCWFKSKN